MGGKRRIDLDGVFCNSILFLLSCTRELQRFPIIPRHFDIASVVLFSDNSTNYKTDIRS